MLTPSDKAVTGGKINNVLERVPKPALGFRHPQEVLNSPLLGKEEKRAILASWASDASAVESRPELRWLPGTEMPVQIDDVLDCLAKLDMPDTDSPRCVN